MVNNGVVVNDGEYAQARRRDAEYDWYLRSVLGAVMQHEFNHMDIRRKFCMSPATLNGRFEKWLTCYNGLCTNKEKTCCGCAAMADLRSRKEIQKQVVSLNPV